MGIRQSSEYEEAVAAANDFGAYRLEAKVQDYIPSARLYRNALRGLDVYGPTKDLIEKILVEDLGRECRIYLQNVIRGLNFLLDARYHPSYCDHRIFPSLRQYHEALCLVEENLASAKNGHQRLATIYSNFVRAIEAVTSGNGIYVVNWQQIPSQSSTLYTKVNLEISRLSAGEFVGIYLVGVKGKGRVPHHAHTYLEEHHYLPEPINGVHQIGDEAARCTQSDIVYVKHGEVHAFRNDEDEERSFLFICGSYKTGPWDFVQDIRTFPELDFPEDRNVLNDVKEIGGQKLQDILDNLLGQRHQDTVKKRLTPDDVRLFHDVIWVDDVYEPSNQKMDLQYCVANGSGQLEIENRSADIRKGDIFIVQSNMQTKIVNDRELVLYQFGLK